MTDEGVACHFCGKSVEAAPEVDIRRRQHPQHQTEDLADAAGVGNYAWTRGKFVWLLDWKPTQAERPDSS